MRAALPAATTIAALVLAAACGGTGASPTASAPVASTPGGSSAPIQPSAGSGGAPEVAQLTVGTLPIVDVAPVHIALARGLFAKEGLTVTTEVMQGGAAAIPALVSGDLDIAFGAWPSFLAANQQGIALRAVADGDAAAPGFTQFLARPDSGLEGKPALMAGKKIAVNTLNSLGEMAVRSTLKQAGVDPQNVQLVEIGFPDMAATLERGNVDVIWAVEPTVTNVKNNLKAVVVVDSYVGPIEGFPVAGYFVTADFATKNPKTVAAFQRAIVAAADVAADKAAVVGILPTFAKLTPELAATLSLPRYNGRLAPATLKRVYDYLVEFKILEPGLDVNALILPTP